MVHFVATQYKIFKKSYCVSNKVLGDTFTIFNCVGGQILTIRRINNQIREKIERGQVMIRQNICKKLIICLYQNKKSGQPVHNF